MNSVGSVEASKPAEVNPEAIANRLNDWVENKGRSRRDSTDMASVASSGDGVEAYAGDVEHSPCSSRSSSAAPQRGVHEIDQKRPGERTAERRISLPEDSLQQKLPSPSFTAKRSRHYNEVAALRAFKKQGGKADSGQSTPESDTSQEEQGTKTRTNTNTNINRTICKSVEPRSKQAWRESQEKAVGFSGDEGGTDSCEEFRVQRAVQQAQEWTHDTSVTAAKDDMPTNTNTNVNAAATSSSEVLCEKLKCRRPSPKELDKPPVQFAGEASRNESGSPSTRLQWKAKRTAHYGREGNALRNVPPPSDESESSGADSR